MSTAVTLAASLLAVTPAQAAVRVTPGSFTGYGFDQCVAPRQDQMDTWLRTSPYWAVGIYIAGENRYCGDDKQVNLDATWVDTQQRNGWRLLPLTVGLQASCSSVDRYKNKRISADPTNSYATARAQGRTEANTTVRAARRLGIAPGSTLWFDLEHFVGGRKCHESALSFLSAWTNKLHHLDYRSGVYSSASSGIRALDDAKTLTPGRFAMPDQVWIADWNNQANVSSTYIRADSWMPRARVHQFRGGHDETYGGVTINIDSNYLDVGRGSVAPRERKHCGGVAYSYARYRRLDRGVNDVQVKSLQCLLRSKHIDSGELRYHFSAKTERAVRAYQTSRSLPATGIMNRRTWTVMLAEGPAPIVKVGSASRTVRRVQRAVNAATGARLAVTGVFDAATTQAMREYQEQRGLARNGVVAEETWADLLRGLR
jgi:hypothetical protein